MYTCLLFLSSLLTFHPLSGPPQDKKHVLEFAAPGERDGFMMACDNAAECGEWLEAIQLHIIDANTGPNAPASPGADEEKKGLLAE